MSQGPRFSVMFFSASEESLEGGRYRLVVEASRFADRNGFEAAWVPERHFASLGGLYPNPSVLAAALATTTERLHLRAGSVVAPLHDPIRVAEEWSMVDNLSGGRVGVSFASGWNPADFAFFPDRYEDRRQEMLRGIEAVHALWRGEPREVTDGTGKQVEVRIYPSPLQETLPTWLTAARSPETFAAAGRIGANVLTHLLDQDVEALAEKVAIYRKARAEAGHDPEAGVVSLMLHTFVAEEIDSAHEAAREPYCEFLKSNVKLLEGLAASRGSEVDFSSLSTADQDAFARFLYDRFASERSLIGTPESCMELVGSLWEAGVDEFACLLDFGPSYDRILADLPHLDALRRRAAEELETRAPAAAAAVVPPSPREVPVAAETADAIRGRLPRELSGEQFYETLERGGFVVPSELRGVTHVWRGEGEALVRIRDGGASSGDGMPSMRFMESALQAVLGALPELGTGRPLPWPVGWRLPSGGFDAAPVEAHAVVAPGADGSRAVEVSLFDGAGNRCGEIAGIELLQAEAGEEVGSGEWFYELTWEPAPAPEATAEVEEAGWLILADRGGFGRQLADALVQRGQRCQLLPVEELAADGELAADALRERLEAALVEEGDDALAGVVHLWGLDATPPEETSVESLAREQLLGSGSALVTTQVLAATSGAPRLWLVTRGSQIVDADAGRPAIAQAPLWGLGRTCAVEHPEVWGGLVDLDPGAPETGADELATLLLGADGEDQVAFRNGERRLARLVRTEGPATTEPPRLHRDATYLVTGGLSGIGRRLAEWLVEHGARHLVLTGRTPLPPRSEWEAAAEEPGLEERIAALRYLEWLGAEVHYRAADVADPDAMAAIKADQKREFPPIRGIFHAASVWRDRNGESLIRTLPQLDVEALEAVFAPKVLGSWVLHELFGDQPLDVFQLFSSGAALTGSAGQGNYAAASLFLDALAHLRAADDLPAVAVDWGPISGAGFGATPEGEKVHEFWEGYGLRRIPVEEMLRVLGELIDAPTPQVAVMNIEWNRLAEAFPALAEAPWSARLIDRAEDAGESALLAHLAEVEPAERADALLEYLRTEVGRIMGLSEPPDPRRKLFDMGLDSLMALELKNRLQRELQQEVQVTAVFNYPTLEALTGYLAEDVLGWSAPGSGASDGESLGEAEGDAMSRIRDLSDEEADRLIAEKLGEEVSQ